MTDATTAPGRLYETDQGAGTFPGTDLGAGGANSAAIDSGAGAASSTKDAALGAASTTKDAALSAGRDAASTAKEQAGVVAGTAKEQAGAVAGVAKEQATQVATQALDTGKKVATQALEQVKTTANSQVSKATDQLRTLGEQSTALSEGRVEEAGPLGEVVGQFGEKLTQYATTLEEKGIEGFAKDIGALARQKPAVFVLGAVAVGILGGRLVKGARTEGESSDSSGRRSLADATPAADGQWSVPNDSPVVPSLGQGDPAQASWADPAPVEVLGAGDALATGPRGTAGGLA